MIGTDLMLLLQWCHILKNAKKAKHDRDVGIT
jgi:hypothetical protein